MITARGGTCRERLRQEPFHYAGNPSRPSATPFAITRFDSVYRVDHCCLEVVGRRPILVRYAGTTFPDFNNTYVCIPGKRNPAPTSTINEAMNISLSKQSRDFSANGPTSVSLLRFPTQPSQSGDFLRVPLPFIYYYIKRKLSETDDRPPLCRRCHRRPGHRPR